MQNQDETANFELGSLPNCRIGSLALVSICLFVAALGYGGW
jgi:hypothetical protein